MRTVYFSRG